MTVWEARFTRLYRTLRDGGASHLSIMDAFVALGQMLDDARAFGSQRVSDSAHQAMMRVLEKGRNT